MGNNNNNQNENDRPSIIDYERGESNDDVNNGGTTSGTNTTADAKKNGDDENDEENDELHPPQQRKFLARKSSDAFEGRWDWSRSSSAGITYLDDKLDSLQKEFRQFENRVKDKLKKPV